AARREKLVSRGYARRPPWGGVQLRAKPNDRRQARARSRSPASSCARLRPPRAHRARVRVRVNEKPAVRKTLAKTAIANLCKPRIFTTRFWGTEYSCFWHSDDHMSRVGELRRNNNAPRCSLYSRFYRLSDYSKPRARAARDRGPHGL